AKSVEFLSGDSPASKFRRRRTNIDFLISSTTERKCEFVRSFNVIRIRNRFKTVMSIRTFNINFRRRKCSFGCHAKRKTLSLVSKITKKNSTEFIIQKIHFVIFVSKNVVVKGKSSPSFIRTDNAIFAFNRFVRLWNIYHTLECWSLHILTQNRKNSCEKSHRKITLSSNFECSICKKGRSFSS